jgi:hypothetical protein
MSHFQLQNNTKTLIHQLLPVFQPVLLLQGLFTLHPILAIGFLPIISQITHDQTSNLSASVSLPFLRKVIPY